MMKEWAMRQQMRFRTSVVLFALALSAAASAEPFVIKDIQVKGLRRITEGTVFNYLPFKVGDLFSEDDTAVAIRALYGTGFFDDVRLEQQGDVLVVIVQERPAIGSISITGNEDIKTEDLLNGLRELDFVEGRVFDKSQLDRIEQELARQYLALGKYSMSVDSTVTPLEDNRVAIALEIFEGEKAKIRRINIVGNEDFSEKELLKQFKSSTPGMFSFLFGGGQYSQQVMAADLETLRSFYLDRGYLRFNIDSTQVTISPDRQQIFVTINIGEGEQYTVSDLRLSGDILVPEQELFELVDIKRGDLFSRKQTSASNERIANRLGDEGFAFANVSVVPDIDDDDNTVAVTFAIDSGRRVYVRRILFAGNHRTRDEVLRREMRQQEGAWSSTKKIERGRVRLERLGFFQGVNVETPEVPGVDDQVDVRYTVTERPAGNLLAGIGFSQNQGLILRTSITQDNFLGSGNRVNFTFNNSDVSRSFALGYLNPYYTIDGVSRGFDFSYRDLDSEDANISDYDAEIFGLSVNFGLPVSEYNFFDVGLDYEQTSIQPGSNAGDLVNDFIREEGREFDLLRLSGRFTYDTRNRAILPDRGTRHRFRSGLGLPAFGGSAVNFYKVDYRADWFIPIGEKYTLRLQSDMGYGGGYGGTSRLPFFEHFYLGGPRSLRGFEENTVGRLDANRNALGGNLKLFGSTELILPLPFLEDIQQLRVTSFFDFGNVYDLEEESLDLGQLRYSVGLSGIWISPVGILSLSLASPIGSKSGDRTQGFQFTFGTSF